MADGDKRLVHDILSESGVGQHGERLARRPVAFIQHGNPEDGYMYEGVCPWCGETTGFIPHTQTKVIGGLYRVLLWAQKMHWDAVCGKRPATRLAVNHEQMAVEVATKPLGTEKLPTFN